MQHENHWQWASNNPINPDQHKLCAYVCVDSTQALSNVLVYKDNRCII